MKRGRPLIIWGGAGAKRKKFVRRPAEKTKLPKIKIKISEGRPKKVLFKKIRTTPPR